MRKYEHQSKPERFTTLTRNLLRRVRSKVYLLQTRLLSSGYTIHKCEIAGERNTSYNYCLSLQMQVTHIDLLGVSQRSILMFKIAHGLNQNLQLF